MRVRRVKLGTSEGLFCTIVVKPMLAGLEARDNRVTRFGKMSRGVLIGGTITAADVPAFGASAQMKPPSARSQALDTPGSARPNRRVNAFHHRFHRLLAIGSSAASFFIAAFSRVTSPAFRLYKAVSAAIARPRVR
jgi:hypothetical protein